MTPINLAALAPALAAYEAAVAAYDAQLNLAHQTVNEALDTSVDPHAYPPATDAWAAVDSLAPATARATYVQVALACGLRNDRLGARYALAERRHVALDAEWLAIWKRLATPAGCAVAQGLAYLLGEVALAMARPVTLVERLGARFFELLEADVIGRHVLWLRQTPGEAARIEADLALTEALDRNPDLSAAYTAWLDAGRKARRARETAQGAVLVALSDQPASAEALRLPRHIDAETLGVAIEVRIERASRKRSPEAA